MNALGLLRQQHRQVEQLFAAIEGAEDDPIPLLDELAAKLAAHMNVEHACLYPVASSVDSTHVAEAYEEHAIVDLALKRLMITTIGTEEFRARVTVLRELVVNHFTDEEASLFAQLEAELSSEVLDALGDEMIVMYRALLAQASPRERSGGSGTWPIVRDSEGNRLDRTG